MNMIIYHRDQSLPSILARKNIDKMMFTEWMHTIEVFEDSRDLIYTEFPTRWVSNAQDKIWIRKKRRNRISKIMYIHPSSDELYYLRMLLNVMKGARSYDNIKIIDGIVHPTFQSACNVLDLLERQ